MKITELIATLQRRLATHGDLEVRVTYENVSRHIEHRHIYRDSDGLWIDADWNYYKPENNHEGEYGT